jgi:hypothetical protein
MTTCDVLPRGALGALALAFVLRAAPAAAQGSPQDQAAARVLFNESRELMTQGKYAEACTKLEGASRLYSGSGVLLNLGDCYEHLGRTASAWTEFSEAASAAERASRSDDFAEARRRQAALEPKLSRLVIRVARAVPGLVVKRDGSAIDRAAWGEAAPVDPGNHTVTAEAPGFLPWTGTASATGEGRSVAVDVPELVFVPTPTPTMADLFPANAPVAKPVATPTADYWTSRRITSATVTGLGVVGVGVGGVLALLAKSNDSSAENETGAQRHADSVSAVNTGNVASVLIVGGAVVAASGLVLWLTAPSSPVQVGTSGRGLVAWGAF